MGILLAFAPFVAFAVLVRVVDPAVALTAGATVSVVRPPFTPLASLISPLNSTKSFKR